MPAQSIGRDGIWYSYVAFQVSRSVMMARRHPRDPCGLPRERLRELVLANVFHVCGERHTVLLVMSARLFRYLWTQAAYYPRVERKYVGAYAPEIELQSP